MTGVGNVDARAFRFVHQMARHPRFSQRGCPRPSAAAGRRSGPLPRGVRLGEIVAIERTELAVEGPVHVGPLVPDAHAVRRFVQHVEVRAVAARGLDT